MVLAKLKTVVKPSVGIKFLEKFGHNLPLIAFLLPVTTEVFSTEYAQQFPERDWILSRILWLKGLEVGFNLGEGCDVYRCDSYSWNSWRIQPMHCASMVVFGC